MSSCSGEAAPPTAVNRILKVVFVDKCVYALGWSARVQHAQIHTQSLYVILQVHVATRLSLHTHVCSSAQMDESDGPPLPPRGRAGKGKARAADEKMPQELEGMVADKRSRLEESEEHGASEARPHD